MPDSSPIRRVKAPGLRWIKRGDTKFSPVWVAQKRDTKAGFRPKTVNLSRLADKPLALAKRCDELTAEMLEWRSARPTTNLLNFDGTVGSLISIYCRHPDSRFQRLRPASRRPYSHYLARIQAEIGQRELNSISGLDLTNWHAKWSDGGKKLAASKTARAVLDAAISFGVEARLPGCSELRLALKTTSRRLPSPRRREYTVSADDVVRLRIAAHEDGRPSSALAYALVFETTLRLWDVIGQWLPFDTSSESELTGAPRRSRGRTQKWFGVQWSDIDVNLILRHVPSKTSAKTGLGVTFPLNRAPMVMQELMHWPTDKRAGPVIVSEATGLPYSSNYFGECWRKDREAAGIPAHVWARDLRASGITEGRAAGATTDDAAKVAGHASTRTTSSVYDRANLAAADRFASARTIFRRKHYFENADGLTMNPLDRTNLEAKLAQAYQVISTLLDDRVETLEGQRLLDYFGRDVYDEDFLPWPRN